MASIFFEFSSMSPRLRSFRNPLSYFRGTRTVHVLVIRVICLELLFAVSDAACAFQPVALSSTNSASVVTNAATRLHQILDEEWQRALKENPTQASGLGDRRYSKLWPDISLTAVRLVVDTGMHSLKWTRQEAIDFFAGNTAKSMLDIENEIDRYIAWPGQALAYKIGELKIQELRSRCERELGSRFDVREFHDIVLKNGAVPLDVLDELVTAWIAAKKQ